jgi:sugar phosphate isomerase/epimerase
MNDPSTGLLEELEWISNQMFDFIDLTIEPPKAYDFNPEEVKVKLGELGLEALGHTNPFLPSIHPLKSIRRACLKEFKKYVDTFRRLEVKLMNIHPYDYRHFKSQEEKIEANIVLLKQIQRLCSKSGIILMLENGKPIDSPIKFQRVLDQIPDIMLHLDIGHANLANKNLTEEFFREFNEKILHIHISDNKGEMDDHLPLGCGNIDWRRMVRLMKGYGYDGTITLEIFSKERKYVLESRRLLRKLWREER